MRLELDNGFALNLEQAGSGPPLVLLHGFMGSAGAWGPLAELLCARFTTLAVDIVGHGASDKPRELDRYLSARAASDVVRAVAAFGFAQASWLGYSMGGRLALMIAAGQPAAVDRLAVIGGSPGLATAEERTARVAADEALAHQIESEGVPAFVDHWESLPLFASQQHLPVGMRRAIRRGRLANEAHGLANSLRGMGAGAQPALHARLTEMTAPALLLAGAEDAKFAAITEEMATAMPNARRLLVADAGHAAHIEKPAYCARTITAFLREGTEGRADGDRVAAGG